MVKSTVESSTNAQGYGLKLSFCHRSSHLIRGGQVVTFHHNSMGIQWGLHVKEPGINITWDISIYLSIYPSIYLSIYIYIYTHTYISYIYIIYIHCITNDIPLIPGQSRHVCGGLHSNPDNERHGGCLDDVMR